MEEWIGIYKGLRLPALGLLLIGIAVYLWLPRNKKRLEQARFDMLEDEYTTHRDVEHIEEEIEEKQLEQHRRNHV